ncbi:MAG: phosphate/phosphite/phosphonate ABC transporter substrate-binding protein [Ardenticatenales bacterium]|jgi:phosphonate transport system substrate-binding protein|nr:phosphate/phosphite/phosphonate ABC transporter substrate-binding protein [Ardenticatenales bacterium]
MSVLLRSAANARRTALALLLAVAVTGCARTANAPETGGEPTSDAGASSPTAVVDNAAPAGGDMATLGTADNPIVMTFVPSGEQETVMTGSEAINKLLQDATGLVIKSNVATSYAAAIEAMGAGNAHVGWLNTFNYLLAHEKFDTRPLLVAERFGSTSYASLVVANADAGIAALADVKGKTFCRADALSTSGWIVPSVMLKAIGVAESDVTVVDSGSHDAVVAAVYAGKDCVAGAVFDDARDGAKETYPDVMDKVLVIATSDDIPNDNVSVIAGVPEDIAKKLAEGLMSIAATEEGAKALTDTYGIEKFQPTTDTFYDAFRSTLDLAGVDVAELAEE